MLDGLPLAIELAAARTRVLSPTQLLERLSDRLRCSPARGSAGDRQATLKSAVDWSWNLLVAWEQAALAQCSVFEGGFTLDAAEAILDVSSFADAPPVVDVVQTLVDKSLLRTWVPIDQARHDIDEPYFGMYLTIHDYAAEKLAASGDGARCAVEERHGAHFARFGGDDAVQALHRDGGAARRRTLTLELDNFVAACRRAVAHGDGETAVATLRAVWEAIVTAGSVRARDRSRRSRRHAPRDRAFVACRGTDRARACPHRRRPPRSGERPARTCARRGARGERRRPRGRGADPPCQRRAAAGPHGRGRAATPSARSRCALRAARTTASRSPSSASCNGRPGAMAEARATTSARWRSIARAATPIPNRRFSTASRSSTPSRVASTRHAHTFESAIALCREIGDRRQAGLVLGNLGMLNVEQGRLDVGRSQVEAALALHRDTGERAEEGIALVNLAGIEQASGRIDEARAKLGAALAIAREVGNRRTEGAVLEALGAIEHEHGNAELALARYDEALALHRAVGNRRAQGSVPNRHLGELRLECWPARDARCAFFDASDVELRANRREADLSRAALCLAFRSSSPLPMGRAHMRCSTRRCATPRRVRLDQQARSGTNRRAAQCRSRMRDATAR
jgi:predicted ATPase